MSWFSKRHILAAGSMLCGVIMLEGGLALFMPQATMNRLRATTEAVVIPSDILPYQLNPGGGGRLIRAEFDTTVTINSLGFRGAEFPFEKHDALRVLTIGDSFTYGYGVENDETYPARLQVELNERLGSGGSEVINGGFAAGFHPDTYYLWLKKFGFEFDPDVILVGFFVGNDLDGNEASENIWTKVDERGLPTQIKKRKHVVEGGRLVREVTPLRYRIPILRNSHLAQGLATFLERFGGPAVSAGEPPALDQRPPAAPVLSAMPGSPPLAAEGESKRPPPPVAQAEPRRPRPSVAQAETRRPRPPIAEGEARPSKPPGGTSIGTGKQSRHYNQYMYRADYLDRTQKVVAQTKTLFIAMAELAQQRDIPFAVVIIPAREQLRPEDFALDLAPFQKGYELDKPQRLFSDFFRREGIFYLDLLPLLREDGAEEKLYFTIDNHWNRAGNEAAGRRIADFLQVSGLTER